MACEFVGCDGRHGWPEENKYGVTCSVNENGHTYIICDYVEADSPDNAIIEYMKGRDNPNVIHGIVIQVDHLGSWTYTTEQIRKIFGAAKKLMKCVKCDGIASCEKDNCIWDDEPEEQEDLYD